MTSEFRRAFDRFREASGKARLFAGADVEDEEEAEEDEELADEAVTALDVPELTPPAAGDEEADGG